MDRSLGFRVYVVRLYALLRLAFATATPYGLTLPRIVTHGLIMQKVRGRALELALPLVVDTRFQVLFHSPPGVLFTFPSRYWFTIGRQEYLALDGGPPGFPHERPSTWYSGTRSRVGSLSRTGLSPSLAGLSMPLLLTNRFVTPRGIHSSRWTALQHRDCNGCDLSRSHGLGFSAFARHY